MKKTLLATLPVAAFVAGMAVVPSVFAAGGNDNITDWAGLSTCLKDPDQTTCKLGTFTGVTGATIEVEGTKTLDLNSQTVTTESAGALFELRENDKLTIANGTMKATKPGAGIRLWGGAAETAAAVSTSLTIESNAIIQDLNLMITNNEPNKYNYGSQLDVYGQVLNTGIGNNVIYIDGDVNNTTNAPVINIHDGARVESIKGDKIPFYLAGYGTTTIGQATVKGVSGVAIKAGVLNLNGANIEATGNYNSGEPYSNGVYSTGAAVQIEANASYAGQIDVNINGGTSLTSAQGNAIQAYGNAQNQVKELALEGENIVLKSAEGRPVLGVSSEIAESFPEATYDGEPIDLEAITTAWDSIPESESTPEENPENPNTADAIATYITIAAVALVGLGATAVVAYKSRR